MPRRVIRIIRWSILVGSVLLALSFLYWFLLNVWRTALPATRVHPELYIYRGLTFLGLFLLTTLVGIALFFWLRKQE